MSYGPDTKSNGQTDDWNPTIIHALASPAAKKERRL